jgi:hypothetical protein
MSRGGCASAHCELPAPAVVLSYSFSTLYAQPAQPGAFTMFNFIRRFHGRFVLWRAARDQDPDIMLHGIRSEVGRLLTFRDLAENVEARRGPLPSGRE